MGKLAELRALIFEGDEKFSLKPLVKEFRS